MKKPQIIDGGRQRMANLTVMKQHFDLLEETLKRLCIFDKGQFIFNMDETGFGKSTVIDKVCTPKSSHSYTKMVTTSQHTTAVVCTSADGNVLPTMVIYEKSFPSGAYRRGIPEAWLFARSPNGYVDSELFIQWFKEIFLNSTSHLSQHNILLTMDNHESHLSIELIDLAIARNVDLFCLPPHTTHILQPLDVGCFKPLKKEFAQVLSTAVDKALSPYIVKNAFRKCGILPFNREAIDRKKLAPLDKSYKGSTSDHTDTDPLCHSCGQFVYGHPLVKEGLIPQDLADIFVPIIGKAKKQLNTRVVTVARRTRRRKIPRKQPRQNSKTSVNKQKSKKKSKKPVEKLTPEVEISECGDDLPELSRPKPKQKRKRKTVDGGMEMSTISDLKDCEDDECYTCGVCGVRGCVQDDNNGILWVGCDNDRCMKWFHRECIPSDQLPYVDLSLIVDNSKHQTWSGFNSKVVVQQNKILMNKWQKNANK
ncbi:unnamed protein product [Mytilus edulis]|uniref:DDE-1 domain-containing protein n=1 Tax=Mytilus edulis TaxID=6550 RepID=A0A8S3TC23_MYTED|nr:unnamed protein product [Mytilus edulis]